MRRTKLDRFVSILFTVFYTGVGTIQLFTAVEPASYAWAVVWIACGLVMGWLEYQDRRQEKESGQ